MRLIKWNVVRGDVDKTLTPPVMPSLTVNEPLSYDPATGILSINLTGITQRLQALENEADIDLTPLINRITTLENKPDPNVDLTGVYATLNTKLDSGDFLQSGNNVLRVVSSTGSPSMDINRNGSITFYYQTDITKGVILSPYAVMGGGGEERGIQTDRLQLNGGRFDFQPYEDKAEFRVYGNDTQFNIFNRSSQTMMLTIAPANSKFQVWGRDIA